MDFEIISLNEKIKETVDNEAEFSKLKSALCNFKCSKNLDEQDFLHNKAIDFELHNIARTYLLISNQGIIGYFSLAIKSISLEDCTKSKRKDITSGRSNENHYPAFLIGHIAKDERISESLGTTLLDCAITFIYEAQVLVGGRLAYLDCKDEQKLKNLYEGYGFKYFNTNPTTKLLQYYIKLD